MAINVWPTSSLRGSVALVTGGGIGIGRGIALALAHRGVDVALVGRRREPLEVTAAEVERLGVRVVAISADITTASGRDEALRRARSTLGPLDILVHNAGILAGGELHVLAEEEIASALATNLAAPLLLTHAALPDLLARRGSVVLVGSGMSHVPLPGASVYAASKAGLRAFGEVLRYELEPHGAHVLIVYPPATDTGLVAGMADAGGVHYPLARPEAIGEHIAVALEARRRELHFAGPERLLAIGYHLAPRLVRRLLSHQRAHFFRMMAAPRSASSGKGCPPPGYDPASRDLWERLRRFRRAHPTITTPLGDHEWSYLRGCCGTAPVAPSARWSPAEESVTPSTTGDEALLLLPGAPGQAEHCFVYIEALESDYRVLCPSYPSSIRHLDELANGAIALLRREGIERAHIIGGSYGCMVARAIAARAPELVATLILEHPIAPRSTRATLDPLLAPLLAPLSRALVGALPMSLLRRLIALACSPFLRRMAQGRAFWRDTFRTLIAGLSREDCRARLAVLLDYDRHGDVHGKLTLAAPVLLVEAEGDRLASRRERARIRAEYPQARVVSVAGASHVGALEMPERYIAVFRAFLSDASSGPVWTER